ncbi:VWA domain-containing protein [Frigidibacter sp. SD6-1]|uniref:VWA domain-containing protein n=1 Tax=Frigidibacter sp. SD6-1 TaxID=3032581 RepID=UPI0024E027B5|nr:VWA domain-containing protein [Frigidibacter sp. SD6-1]
MPVQGMPATSATGLVRRARQSLITYHRADEGSMLIFGMFLFVSMLLIAGMALDLMRFEERRTKLQATIDRAVLAAADMDQTLDCKSVVKDWFVKAGAGAPSDDQITCTKNDFGSEVKVTASTTMPTWFMKMVGVPTLQTPTASTAEEKIGSVEISLVLDVSGSMWGSRLTNLKAAASSFVDQMFASVETGKLSISIVPYSTQVSLGQDLLKYFYYTNYDHGQSSCLEFATTDFSATAVRLKPTVPTSADVPYRLNGHFDPFYSNNRLSLPNCPPDTKTSQAILPFSASADALKARIKGLSIDGNTSIDLGMKWGAALLDPSMQPVVTKMIGEGKVAGALSGRPYSFTKADGTRNNDVLKVIVVMTDGQNTVEYKLRDGYENGASNLFMTNTKYPGYDGFSGFYKRFSWYDPSRSGNKYYSLSQQAWRSQPWGANPLDIPNNYNGDDDKDGVKDEDVTTQLNWDEVWAMMTVLYLSDEIVYKVYGSTWIRNQWRPGYNNSLTTSYVYGTKDSNVLSVCSAAKDKGVKVYAIAFEAPTNGQNLLKQCASSPAHYYYTSGSNISHVFSSIANSINKLRLTH